MTKFCREFLRRKNVVFVHFNFWLCAENFTSLKKHLFKFAYDMKQKYMYGFYD
jgi:hypothetical protein